MTHPVMCTGDENQTIHTLRGSVTWVSAQQDLDGTSSVLDDFAAVRNVTNTDCAILHHAMSSRGAGVTSAPACDSVVCGHEVMRTIHHKTHTRRKSIS